MIGPIVSVANGVPGNLSEGQSRLRRHYAGISMPIPAAMEYDPAWHWMHAESVVAPELKYNTTQGKPMYQQSA